MPFSSLSVIDRSQSVHSFKSYGDGELGTGEKSDPLLMSMNRLFRTGSKRPLELQDLGELPDDISTQEMSNNFSKAWDDELKLPPEKRSLWRVMRRSIGVARPLAATLLALLSANTVFAVPLLQVCLVIQIDLLLLAMSRKLSISFC